MRFYPGERVRWWDDPTHTGTVERGGAEVVDVLWDNGSGYHGHSDPIEYIDDSGRTKRLLRLHPRIGDRVRLPRPGGGPQVGTIAGLCHCEPCEGSFEKRWVIDLDAGARVEHVYRLEMQPPAR